MNKSQYMVFFASKKGTLDNSLFFGDKSIATAT